MDLLTHLALFEYPAIDDSGSDSNCSEAVTSSQSLNRSFKGLKSVDPQFGRACRIGRTGADIWEQPTHRKEAPGATEDETEIFWGIRSESEEGRVRSRDPISSVKVGGRAAADLD
jgi:hypothetical protein